MSTSDMGTDPVDERAHLEGYLTDLALVADLIMWYQMPYLTARRLAQLNCIQRWPDLWCPYNIKRFAQARREDDTRDWYFPLFFATDTQTSWKGIHHISLGEIDGARPLALPPLAQHLPHQYTNVDVLSSAGGLLLLQLHTKPQRVGVLERLWRLFWTHADGTMESQNWKPLVVSNPSTKEWRELPPPDCRDVGLLSWDYDGLRVHMMVDDEANSYKLILIFMRQYICVYKSTSNSWTCKAFPRPGPWGDAGDMEVGGVYASAVVDGRVCFADLAYSNAGRQQWGDVRLFEIDEEAGTWKPPIQYALHHFLQRSRRPHGDHGFRLGSNAFEIVECMGVLYAVVPTKLDEQIVRADGRWPDQAADMEIFPLQFRILQLSGAALPTHHGVLSIQNSFTGGDSMYRRQLLSHYTNLCWSWFRCTARGSVIWVTFEDYLLQYDVLSSQSQTHMIESMNGDDVVVDMFYTPSFHMKP